MLGEWGGVVHERYVISEGDSAQHSGVLYREGVGLNFRDKSVP